MGVIVRERQTYKLNAARSSSKNKDFAALGRKGSGVIKPYTFNVSMGALNANYIKFFLTGVEGKKRC